jgi:hypothetical protein
VKVSVVSTKSSNFILSGRGSKDDGGEMNADFIVLAKQLVK